MMNANRLLLVILLLSISEIEAQQLRKRSSVCGDGVCQVDENCKTCPSDCCAIPTDDDNFIHFDESRVLGDEALPRNGLKLCFAGPNQAFPCEEDVDCGKVCSLNPTQVCYADADCYGDDNVCYEFGGSCAVFLLSTSEPSSTPSASEVPSLAPTVGTDTPSLTPSASPLPSFVPSVSPAPSASLSPTDIPTSLPSSKPSISTEPTISSSPTISPTESGMPSIVPSATPSSQPTVTFFAMGDVPFSEEEECLIPFELVKLNSSNLDGQFLVHLGDIRDSFFNETRQCPKNLFTNITSTFSSSPIQTFFLLGERGWLDCPIPDMGYKFAQDHLVPFSNRTDLGWPEFAVNVTRHENRTELFSFMLGDILFLGQSLPGPARNSSVELTIRDKLLVDNANWTEQAFADNVGLYEAVVVFGNDFLDTVNDGYMERVLSIAANPDYGEPPVLLLQNGNSFQTNTVDMYSTNVMWASTDDTVTPLAITVKTWASELEDIFLFDRRCYCTFGHRPTRNKEYLPWDECANVCDEPQSQCESVSSCSPPGNSC